jgi:hypothetical protein
VRIEFEVDDAAGYIEAVRMDRIGLDHGKPGARPDLFATKMAAAAWLLDEAEIGKFTRAGIEVYGWNTPKPTWRWTFTSGGIEP